VLRRRAQLEGILIEKTAAKCKTSRLRCMLTRAAKGEIIEQGRIILIRVQQLNGSERFFLDALARARASFLRTEKERRKEAILAGRSDRLAPGPSQKLAPEKKCPPISLKLLKLKAPKSKVERRYVDFFLSERRCGKNISV